MIRTEYGADNSDTYTVDMHLSHFHLTNSLPSTTTSVVLLASGIFTIIGLVFTPVLLNITIK